MTCRGLEHMLSVERERHGQGHWQGEDDCNFVGNNRVEYYPRDDVDEAGENTNKHKSDGLKRHAAGYLAVTRNCLPSTFNAIGSAR